MITAKQVIGGWMISCDCKRDSWMLLTIQDERTELEKLLQFKNALALRRVPAKPKRKRKK